MRAMSSARRVPPRLAGIGIAVLAVLLSGRPAAADVTPVAPTDAGAPAAPDASAPDAAVPSPADIMLTPDLSASPPLVLEAPSPAPAPPPRPPFYRRDWFWGAVGLVALTAAILLIATTASTDQAPPPTTLGNMRAF